MTTTRQQDLSGNAGKPCPLTAAVDVIGGRWSLIVLYWLSTGTRRATAMVKSQYGHRRRQYGK